MLSSPMEDTIPRLPVVTKQDEFSKLVASVLSSQTESDLQKVRQQLNLKTSDFAKVQHRHGNKCAEDRRCSEIVQPTFFEKEREEREEIETLWEEVRSVVAVSFISKGNLAVQQLFLATPSLEQLSESQAMSLSEIHRRRLLSYIESNFSYIYVGGIEGVLEARDVYELADTVMELPFLTDGDLTSIQFSIMPAVKHTAETFPEFHIQFYYSYVAVKAAFKACNITLAEWHEHVVDFYYDKDRPRPQKVQQALLMNHHLNTIMTVPTLPSEPPTPFCHDASDWDDAFQLALKLEQQRHKPFEDPDNTIALEYQRGEQIGKGGFGTVYRCTNVANGQFLALKEVPLRKEREQEIRIEVDTLKRLSNKNVVKYFGCRFDRERGKVQVLMEYAPKSLREVAVGSKGLALPLIANYARKILDGLAYLHEHRIIHRDIKAANVLVTESGEAKLTDFGTALVVGLDTSEEETKLEDLDDEEREFIERQRRLQKARGKEAKGPGLQGTPLFMAPELMRGCLPSETSDIWSFGCLLLELLTGQSPWQELLTEGPLPTELLLYKIGQATQGPQIPAGIEVTDEFRDFLNAALAIDASKRPPARLLRRFAFLTNDGFDAARLLSSETSSSSSSSLKGHRGSAMGYAGSGAEVLGPAQYAVKAGSSGSGSNAETMNSYGGQSTLVTGSTVFV